MMRERFWGRQALIFMVSVFVKKIGCGVGGAESKMGLWFTVPRTLMIVHCAESVRLGYRIELLCGISLGPAGIPDKLHFLPDIPFLSNRPSRAFYS